MDVNRCLDDIDPDFKYTDANESHSWLISYPDKLKPSPTTLKMSSKNEDYSEPKVQKPSNQGKRKRIMEAFFRQIISEEMLSKYDEEGVEVESYETDYSEHYKHPDDLPLPGECLSKNEKFKLQEKSCPHELSKIKRLEELKAKYPLYLSTPLTFFSQMTGRPNFRKSSLVTRNPDEV